MQVLWWSCSLLWGVISIIQLKKCGCDLKSCIFFQLITTFNLNNMILPKSPLLHEFLFCFKRSMRSFQNFMLERQRKLLVLGWPTIKIRLLSIIDLFEEEIGWLHELNVEDTFRDEIFDCLSLFLLVMRTYLYFLTNKHHFDKQISINICSLWQTSSGVGSILVSYDFELKFLNF